MASVPYRLRARRRVDSAAAASALGRSVSRRRRVAPPCWAWAWPLSEGDGDAFPAPDSAWTGNVRAAAVADGGEALALVSAAGSVVLATLPPSAAARAANGGSGGSSTKPPLLRIVTLNVDVSKLEDPDPAGGILFAHATSVALFHVADQPSGAVDLVVAVGYASGAVAFFDASTAALCAVTRPVFGQPVRRLRFVPRFHMLDPPTSPMAFEYPYPSSNSGLFCVFGWSGTVGRLPIAAVLDAIASRRCDSRGARWILWRLQAQDAVVDAVPCGSEPSAVCEMDPRPADAPLRIVATGINPPIAAFACASRGAFSARDAARKAATAVFSVAKGVVYSGLSSFVPRFARSSSGADPDAVTSTTPASVQEARGPVPPAAAAAANAVAAVSSQDSDEDVDDRKPVSAVVRASLSWTDEPDGSSSLLRFGFQDVGDAARKSITARLERRHSRSFARVHGVLKGESSRSTSRKSSADRGVAWTVDDYPDPSAGSTGGSLPQNARLVNRCVASPMPCTLFASMDTLGRVLVMDARDLCVLRVFKGYRDAHCAWLPRDEPILAILSPRRAVLELHSPLDAKHVVAFNVEPGTLLLQSTSCSVYFFAPSGVLYELCQSRKTADRSSPSPFRKRDEKSDSEATKSSTSTTSGISLDVGFACSPQKPSKEGESQPLPPPPPSEVVENFLQCCKSGQASQAVEMLDLASKEGFHQVAHLMALLACTVSFVRPEVHVAVASKAARLAAGAGNADLEVRYEAHSRLGEAAALLAAEVMPGVVSVSGSSGPRLGSDESFAAFLRGHEDDILWSESGGRPSIAVDMPAEHDFGNDMRRKVSSKSGNASSVAAADDVVNCERFILAHTLIPCDEDIGPNGRDYTLRPRDDLSAGERVWLSRAYFARLIAAEETGSSGRTDTEPLSCQIVFTALRGVLGYSVEDILSFFLQFFLWSPIESLLATPLGIELSGLRCALEKLRAPPNRSLVDNTILDACESSVRLANATLLVRLCVAHEGSQLADVDPRFMILLEKLNQGLQLRSYIKGSTVEESIVGRLSARLLQGVPSESERQAVRLLSRANDDWRAALVLRQLGDKTPRLEWHEEASISEVALREGRRRLTHILNDAAYEEIAPNVAGWIQADAEVDEGDELIGSAEVISPSEPGLHAVAKRADELKGIQALLIAAHYHFPATSIDTVRCTQLAEAINVILSAAERVSSDEMDED